MRPPPKFGTPRRGGHASEDHNYLHAVAESIAEAGAVLITAPANAKTELVKHIHHHGPKLMNIIVGVKTVDHRSDAQLIAYARKYLKATDRMRPQKPMASLWQQRDHHQNRDHRTRN